MALTKYLRLAQGDNLSDTAATSIGASDLTIQMSTIAKWSSNGGKVIIDRGTASEEVVYATGKAGANLTIATDGRGLDNTTAQAHNAGATIESVPFSADHNNIVTALSKYILDTDGSASITLGSDATGDIYYRESTGALTRLAIGSTDNVLKVTGGKPAWGTTTSGTSFWTDMPGTPTRVSDTQFTITDTSNANLYDQIFKKGVILIWMESSTFQTAMVISSSYGANTVTINLVGDSLTAGFTAMKYAIPMANVETFIIPGSLATGTDLAKTWYVDQDVYILSADAYVKTAGTTNSSVFDINDDGTTKFTTKPTITTGTTSDIDNVADNPSTAVAAGSLVTIDIDAVSTTVPIEAYIKVFSYPVSWRYRT